MSTRTGNCYCGTIKVEVSGEPVGMGFCHCDSCKSWSGTCMQPFALWMPGSVRLVAGADRLGSTNKTAQVYRKFCTACGGHVMAELATSGLTNLYPSMLPALHFAPQLHLYYGEKVVSMADGLPKYRDLPAQYGGSGTTLPD